MNSEKRNGELVGFSFKGIVLKILVIHITVVNEFVQTLYQGWP